MTKIKGVVREVYGNRMAYCIDKEQEKQIIKLTGKKTLVPETVQALRALGVEVEIIDPYTMGE